MQIQQNFSLKQYNSFGIDAKAERFISVKNTEELRSILRKTYAAEIFVLGGGSNMLLTKDIRKTVIHIGLKGKQIISQNDDEVIIQAKAGENWHEFVLWALDNNYGGLENLSLIPGNVGTAPIQNIGAYGVELKDVFSSCKAMNVQTLEEKEFKLEDCEFGYRNSIFKNSLKGRYIITSVNFKLTKKDHSLHTEYGSINVELEKQKIEKPGIKDISDAVIRIRQSKLPDPKELGNSGSFFKNPVIGRDQFEKLKLEYPEMPSYQVSTELLKVPAGWLIDKAGLKAYREGDAGVHKNQALVLVNYGEATGKDILDLAHKVQATVHEKFGIPLEPEVNII
ncbi:UDP-N-acetylmuramate dehydrogenase [Christiangramia salexigens]|uniref:UDP-N-acetylenolpyruvoylglucosamine reductase n=1 Tax=Christiangramia salexigens TaxID=1913577 RepID=A0A1L3J848_9FLAO|nr:UDP-N-acetylmuramate dehydrogenase [Christiangramia salexigens]APG61281.1 UDP-N-acetylenolpyruvoylglucosamine reductase [Christiangramia salexigens]